jgi:hypothetical protein
MVCGRRLNESAEPLSSSYLGPLLTIAAGFFDGEHTIVEPLTDTYMMLPSRFNQREQRLAHILSFTRKAIQTLLKSKCTVLSLALSTIANGPPA